MRESVSAALIRARAYKTEDGTAEAGADYTAANGTLTFRAGTTTATIEVAILDDTTAEETEMFTVTLSSTNGATLSAVSASADGTITDDGDTTTTDPVGPVRPVDPGPATALELSSLAVTGGGTMYPPFDADTLHYALTCNSSPTPSVAAETGRDGAQLTLLRADTADNVASTTGALFTWNSWDHRDVLQWGNDCKVGNRASTGSVPEAPQRGGPLALPAAGD